MKNLDNGLKKDLVAMFLTLMLTYAALTIFISLPTPDINSNLVSVLATMLFAMLFVITIYLVVKVWTMKKELEGEVNQINVRVSKLLKMRNQQKGK